VAIAFDRYRWNRGVAESRMAVKIRWPALANVALCRFKPIVEAPFLGVDLGRKNS
jgi:hypothetical protein